MADNKKLKKVVRARMEVTGESYVTALMRVRECGGRAARPTSTDPDHSLSEEVSETIRLNPPRRGQ